MVQVQRMLKRMANDKKPDPRVYFAAERTFLAWVRSGITLMALGFVVAKFGLFIDLLSTAPTTLVQADNTWRAIIETKGTNYLGVLIMLIGVSIILFAQNNHHNFIKTLPVHDIPALTNRWLPQLLSYAVVVAGFLLALYLIVI